MKITLNKLELLKAIETLSSVAKENKIRPVISGIKITANENIELQATDLENTMNYILSGDIEKEGACVIVYEEIKEYLKELQDLNVTLELEEGMLNVKTETGEIKTSIYDVEEYPNIKIKEKEGFIEMESENLISAINKVKFAIPLKSDNLAIFGLRIIGKNNKVTFCSTDTYKMAMYTEKAELKKEAEITISRTALEAITKSLNGYKGKIKISCSGNLCSLQIGDITFCTRLIDLDFPDIFRIEENFTSDIKLELKKEVLYQTFKRVRSIVKSNTEMRNAAVFNFSEKGLIIKATLNKAKIKEEIKDIKTKDLKITLNVEYMLNFLDSCKNLSWFLPENSDGIIKMQEENYRFYFMPLATKINKSEV